MPVCPAAPVCACTRPGCRRPRRYPSDTTDAEWALIAPLLPVPACQTRAGGRPEEHSRRVVVDAIRYVIHNGCVWRALPADFPPWPTLRSLFPPGGAPLDGVIEQVADGLLQQVGVPRTMHGARRSRIFAVGARPRACCAADATTWSGSRHATGRSKGCPPPVPDHQQ